MPDRQSAASMHPRRLLHTLIVTSVFLATVLAYQAVSRSGGDQVAALHVRASTITGTGTWGQQAGYRGLQGVRSQAQQELAKQAMRLEILLGQTASSRPGVLDLLQGGVRLEELTQAELMQHTAHLQRVLAEPSASNASNATMPLANGTAGHAAVDEGAEAEGQHVVAPAPACERLDLPDWCYAFEACNITRVALVGNGPLTTDQREDLRSGGYQVIVRFNFMNNRAPGEQTDVWVMRHADAARLHFWGISQMDRPAAREALAAAKSIWFLGRPPDGEDPSWYMMQPVYRQYPEVKARHHMLLDPDLTQGFDVLSGNQSLGGGELSPSTGWYGAAFTLECSTLIGAELHVFGFNWNDAHADTHTIADEEMLFRAAEADGTLVIHPTACNGLRSCLPAAHHKDCHVISAQGKEVFSCANVNLGLKPGASGFKFGLQHTITVV